MILHRRFVILSAIFYKYILPYGSSDLIVKRRDSPFCPGILCFLQEESIRNKKVPKDKISGTVKTLITTTANRQYLILT